MCFQGVSGIWLVRACLRIGEGDGSGGWCGARQGDSQQLQRALLHDGGLGQGGSRHARVLAEADMVLGQRRQVGQQGLKAVP